IEHIKSSRNDYKECKNAYYPTNKCSEDLIDEWHKYVHMIEG
ncbi:KAP family P-loop domain-containing protein, partial [Acinetobacter baumannii]